MRTTFPLLVLACPITTPPRIFGADACPPARQRTTLKGDQDARLFVVLVHNADHQLIGVGPFYLSSMRALKLLTLKCLRVLGDSQSGAEYGDLIIRDDWEEPAIEAIASCLAEARDEWDCLWLPSVAGWTGARERWMTLFEELGTEQVWKPGDFSFIRLPDTYEKYLEELPGKARRETARLRRRGHRVLATVGPDESDRGRGVAGKLG